MATLRVSRWQASKSSQHYGCSDNGSLQQRCTGDGIYIYCSDSGGFIDEFSPMWNFLQIVFQGSIGATVSGLLIIFRFLFQPKDILLTQIPLGGVVDYENRFSHTYIYIYMVLRLVNKNLTSGFRRLLHPHVNSDFGSLEKASVGIYSFESRSR